MTEIVCQDHIGLAVMNELSNDVKILQFDEWVLPGGCAYCDNDSEFLVHWFRKED